LRSFADAYELNFYPQKVRNAIKYKDFPIQKGNKIQYEENIMNGYREFGKVEVSDITLTEGARQERNDTHITVIHVSDLDVNIPDFALEPEQLWTKISEMTSGKDIDFQNHPLFSKKYYLRGEDEKNIRNFFTESLIGFLETHDNIHVESHKNKLLVYMKRDQLTTDEIKSALDFINGFVSAIAGTELEHA
jgi:hypothetical protein